MLCPMPVDHPGMALAAGLLFGTCFNPPQHIVDQTKEMFCAKVRAVAVTAVTAVFENRQPHAHARTRTHACVSSV